MNWYYFHTQEKDYIAQKPRGYYLGVHDIDLGEGDVEELLRARGFTPGNIKRLIMGSNRREDFVPEKQEGELTMERKPCPECGKELTWLADGSRPRQHICEPQEPTKEEVTQEQPKSTGITLATVISKYIETRDQIAAEKKIFDEKVAELKKFQTAREQWLAGQLDKMGVTSAKQAGAGIAFFKTRSSATVADAQQFTDWVLDDWDARNHFLERRVSKTAVDDWVEQGETLPAGTNYNTVRVVQVNRD
jgi:hypothetical protein